MKSTVVLSAVFWLVVAACADRTSFDTAPLGAETLGPARTTVTESSLLSGGFPDGVSALDDIDADSFPDPLIPTAEIISGGPPPDGIPPIDEPEFVSVGEADEWIADEEPVAFIEIDGDARAYPVQVMIWHEIVNDTVGGVPVSVTYCPLCNSAISYVRQVDGLETTFGTSGRLYASALVMYDRATETLWTHYDGRAVVGLLTGRRLEPVASPLLAWSEFKASFPDGRVLDREATGFDRPYGTNPYAGYDDPDSTPFLFRGDVDDRARSMQRVVGIRTEGAARAWSLEAISGGDAQATNSEVGGTEVVILWAAGQTSALEADTVVGGRDVGSVGVFSPMVEGEVLTFGAEGDHFVDEQTGSAWDLTGRALVGPLAGAGLTAIPHLDTFWFAWSTYAPETDLVES